MTIQICTHEDLTEQEVKFIVDAASKNKTRRWKFHDGNKWSFVFEGSYCQACHKVRKCYKSYFRTNYGILYITEVNVIVGKPEIFKK